MACWITIGLAFLGLIAFAVVFSCIYVYLTDYQPPWPR